MKLLLLSTRLLLRFTTFLRLRRCMKLLLLLLLLPTCLLRPLPSQCRPTRPRLRSPLTYPPLTVAKWSAQLGLPLFNNALFLSDKYLLPWRQEKVHFGLLEGASLFAWMVFPHNTYFWTSETNLFLSSSRKLRLDCLGIVLFKYGLPAWII